MEYYLKENSKFNSLCIAINFIIIKNKMLYIKINSRSQINYLHLFGKQFFFGMC
jgi:hypothetical protein